MLCEPGGQNAWESLQRVPPWLSGGTQDLTKQSKGKGCPRGEQAHSVAWIGWGKGESNKPRKCGVL